MAPSSLAPDHRQDHCPFLQSFRSRGSHEHTGRRGVHAAESQDKAARGYSKVTYHSLEVI
jgi:hypothetical protein